MQVSVGEHRFVQCGATWRVSANQLPRSSLHDEKILPAAYPSTGERMAEPNWLIYLGATTGVIGAVTGIAGAVMGYVSYRRSGEMKAMDLRLELRKAQIDYCALIRELPALLERAKASRTAVSAATGMLGSGALQHWSSEWEKDDGLARAWGNDLPNPDADHRAAEHKELESKLVQVHEQHGHAVRLRDKYLASQAEDDRQRDHIKAAMLVRTQAMQGRQ